MKLWKIQLVPYRFYSWIERQLPGEYVDIEFNDPNIRFRGYRVGPVAFLGNFTKTKHFQPGGKYSHIRVK